jgi:ribA/ribD-fused uncharacterized protein
MSEEKINHVYFYGHKQTTPLNYMSQWYPCAFTEGIHTFNSAEQYMMYHKALLFEDVYSANTILRCTNPQLAKAFGRNVRNFTKSVWTIHRESIVYNGNKLKFEQNRDIYLELMAYPANTMFVEASPLDRIWGVGFGVQTAPINKARWGLNLLGRAITKVHQYYLNTPLQISCQR